MFRNSHIVIYHSPRAAGEELQPDIYFSSPSAAVSSRTKHNYRTDVGMASGTAENCGNTTLRRFSVAYRSETAQQYSLSSVKQRLTQTSVSGLSLKSTQR